MATLDLIELLLCGPAGGPHVGVAVACLTAMATIVSGEPGSSVAPLDGRAPPRAPSPDSWRSTPSATSPRRAPFERFLFAPATAVAAGLTAIVAHRTRRR